MLRKTLLYLFLIVFFSACNSTKMQEIPFPGNWAMSNFGVNIAVSGTTAVVSANYAFCEEVSTGESTSMNVFFSSSLSIYNRDENSGNWYVAQEIFPPRKEEHFGRSFALDGNTLVVVNGGLKTCPSSPSGIYIYRRSNFTWKLVQEITSCDGTMEKCRVISLAISGDTFIAVALSLEKAYVFNYDGAEWKQSDELILSSEETNGILDGSLAIDKDTVLLGLAKNDKRALSYYGASVFERNVSGWQQKGRITLALPIFSTNAYSTHFLAIKGNTVALGVADKRYHKGVLSLFSRSDDDPCGWSTAYHVASNDEAYLSISLEESRVAVGILEGSSYPVPKIRLYEPDSSGKWLETHQEILEFPYFVNQVSVALDDGALFAGLTAEDYGDVGPSILYLTENKKYDSGVDWGVFPSEENKEQMWEKAHSLKLPKTKILTDRVADNTVISGNTLVASYSIPYEGNGEYQIYLFEKSGNIAHWSLTTQIMQKGDIRFGKFFALHDNMLVVTATSSQWDESNPRKAYLFERNGAHADWQNTHTFTYGSVDRRHPLFVATNGNVVVMGVSDQSISVFERNDKKDSWHEKMIMPSETGCSHSISSAFIDNDTLVLLGGGTLCFFEKNQGGKDNWGFVTSYTVDGRLFYGQNSVSLSGDRVAFALFVTDDMLSFSSQEVHILERNKGGTNKWGLVKKIVYPYGSYTDVDLSVAIRKNILVASFAPSNVSSFAHKAYVFKRNSGGTNNWGVYGMIAPPKLVPRNEGSDQHFATSLSLSGDSVAIGSDFSSVYVVKVDDADKSIDIQF